jgi:hypothetical protein
VIGFSSGEEPADSCAQPALVLASKVSVGKVFTKVRRFIKSSRIN